MITYDTCTYKLVLGLIWKQKKSQDLGGNRAHGHHNSGVTALPLSYKALGVRWWGVRYWYTSALQVGAYIMDNSSRLS